MFNDDFIAIASHELKTPLTVLKMQVDLIQESLDKFGDGPLKVEMENNLRLGREQVLQMTELTERLLDVSQLKAQQFVLHPKKINLIPLLQQMLEQYRGLFDKAGCEVTLKASKEIWGEWDEVRLKQVFTNLLNNAMKYGAGSPIEILAESDRSRALVTIKDHGIGLATENQELIFERFERVDPKKRYTGLGLGLYIAKEIVKAHKGQIRVESSPGKGASFIVELPF